VVVPMGKPRLICWSKVARWGGLNGLLADLMSGYAAQQIPVPDQADLGADLRALAREVVASLQDPAIRAAFWWRGL
jgi:hypothetical protein